MSKIQCPYCQRTFTPDDELREAPDQVGRPPRVWDAVAGLWWLAALIGLAMALSTTDTAQAVAGAGILVSASVCGVVYFAVGALSQRLFAIHGELRRQVEDHDRPAEPR